MSDLSIHYVEPNPAIVVIIMTVTARRGNYTTTAPGSSKEPLGGGTKCWLGCCLSRMKV